MLKDTRTYVPNIWYLNGVFKTKPYENWMGLDLELRVHTHILGSSIDMGGGGVGKYFIYAPLHHPQQRIKGTERKGKKKN